MKKAGCSAAGMVYALLPENINLSGLLKGGLFDGENYSNHVDDNHFCQWHRPGEG
jgi:hypothetical protein